MANLNRCRWAPSLGELESTAEKVWGTKKYNWIRDINKPVVFFGLYDFRDYLAIFIHRGKRFILWAGSDILNLKDNFLFNNGKLKWLSKIFVFLPRFMAKWINKNCESWVENEKEKKVLESLGIKVYGVCPSFLGDIDSFDVSYAYSKPIKAYISCSGDRREEYGFGIIERIAGDLPWINFYLYGSSWKTKHKNVIVRGRVPKEVMNEEIKKMQIGLRLNEFDGFSEIMAKSALWGHYQIGKVEHPLIPTFTNDMDLITKLNMLKYKHKPNLEVRNWYRKNLNIYPWTY